jgi:two-component system, NtrC family, sensor histidine kinase HydH
VTEAAATEAPTPPGGGEAPDVLGSRITWLIGLRLVVLSGLLGVVGAFYLREHSEIGAFSSQVVLFTVAAGFAFEAVQAAFLRKRRYLSELAYLQLILDQAQWTALAYVSGGVSSGATSFYGLSCVVAAVAAGVRGVVVAAVSAAVMFGVMCLGFVRGWILPPHDQPTAAYPTRINDVSYHLTLNLLILVVVAVLAGYLAERLRSTGGKLVEATLRAEQAERLAMLGRFTAGLAHEIRNPLGSIAGSIELLASTPSLSTEDKLLCGIIAREASRLNDLMTDMIDLARPKKPEIAPIDAARVASEVARLAANSGRGEDVVVSYEGPPHGVIIQADASQLRQIVWNLVRNAVQASSAGQPVKVRIRQASGEVILEVADRGPGIPDDARAQIFDAFFTTRSHGVGIGLALVKRIVEDHGFTIEVDSGDGKGATFRVRVPTR